MTFFWPNMLWLLAIVPVLVAAYLVVLRRKRSAAQRYASLSITGHANGGASSLKRHAPPVLFLLALMLMIAAVARPAAVIQLPSQHETVILAMDISGSMRAADVEPSRIAAAQAAARTFIAEQPSGTRIGVVAFAATASVVQPPTQSREDVLAAIDRFQLQRGTAVGSGIVVSLATIFPKAGIDVQSLETEGTPRRDARRGAAVDPLSPAQPPAFEPVPPGSYQSAVIVLLTDGQTTTGPDPIRAARMAAERGVRVYTVGVGTAKGEVIRNEGWSMHVSLDEDVLKTVANMTHGEYFYAGSASELKKVYRALNARFVMESRETEVTALVSAAAAALAMLAALLSMLWFNRIL